MRVERRAGKFARALDHVVLSEGGRGRGGRSRVLLGEGGPEPSPGGSANHADEYGAAVEALHGVLGSEEGRRRLTYRADAIGAIEMRDVASARGRRRR